MSIAAHLLNQALVLLLQRRRLHDALLLRHQPAARGSRMHGAPGRHRRHLLLLLPRSLRSPLLLQQSQLRLLLLLLLLMVQL
jgi:hypothetical protein